MSSRIYTYTNGEETFQTYQVLIETTEQEESIYVDYDTENFRGLLDYYRTYETSSAPSCSLPVALAYDLERMSVAIKCESMVVNVEGKRLRVGISTLEKIPYFRALLNFRTQSQTSGDECDLIDRNYMKFRQIISWLRNPYQKSCDNLGTEFDFYCLPHEEVNFSYGTKTRHNTLEMVELLDSIVKGSPLKSCFRDQIYCYGSIEMGKRIVFNLVKEKDAISEIYLYLEIIKYDTDREEQSQLWEIVNNYKISDIIKSINIKVGELNINYNSGEILQVLQDTPFNLFEKYVQKETVDKSSIFKRQSKHILLRIKIPSLSGEKTYINKETERGYGAEISIEFKSHSGEELSYERGNYYYDYDMLDKCYMIVKDEKVPMLATCEQQRLLLPCDHNIYYDVPKNKKNIVISDSQTNVMILIIYFSDIISGKLLLIDDLTISIQDTKGSQLGIVNSDLNRNNQISNFGQYDPHYWVVDTGKIRNSLYPIYHNQKEIFEMKFRYKINLPTTKKVERCKFFFLYTKNL